MSEAYKGLVEDLSKQLADQIESGNKLWIEFRKMQQALVDAENKHRECETRVLRLESENKTQSRRISALETRQQIIRPDTDYIKGG
jgi:vacuolar-type H+-ATPase subunit D/Vma8